MHVGEEQDARQLVYHAHRQHRGCEGRVGRLSEAEERVRVLAAVVGGAVAEEAVAEVLEAGSEAIDNLLTQH